MKKINIKKCSYENCSPETREWIIKAKKLTKELMEDKEKAKDFLVSTGIFTEKGNLRKPYR